MWFLLLFVHISLASSSPRNEAKKLYFYYLSESTQASFLRVSSTYLEHNCIECFTFDGVRFFRNRSELKHFLVSSCNSSQEGALYVRQEICDALSDFLDPNFNGEIISEELATQLIRFMLYRSDITFEYFEDGCYARNVAMREVYRALGIKTTSFLIKADGEKRLSASTPYGVARWLWHVAPSVMVRSQNGTIHRMILDPGLSNNPMMVTEFATLLGFSDCPRSGSWSSFLSTGTTCRTYLETEDRFYDMLLFFDGAIRYYQYLGREERIEHSIDFMHRENVVDLVRARKASRPRVDPISNTQI